MTQPDAKKSKGSPRRRRRALVVLAVIAALGLAAWVFRAPMLASVLHRLARAHGIDARWTSLELDGLSHLSIVGASARRVPDIDASADSIDVDFDLFALAGGDLAGLQRVRARGVQAELGPFTSTEPAPGPPGAIHIPRSLPHVDLDIRRGVLHLAPGRRVEADGATLAIHSRRAEAQAAHLAWFDGDVAVSHPLDLRAHWDNGLFEVEACTWDPRIRVDHASGDVRRAAEGTFDLEATVHGFEGHGALRLHLEHEVVSADAHVTELDVGAAARAWFAVPFGGIEARADVDASVRMPLASPAAFTGTATLAATAMRLFDRSFEIVDARVTAREHEIDIERLFVSDGPDAAAARGSLPRPIEPCTWLDHTVAWAEADVADLARFLADDIGLASVHAEPGDAAVGPLHVTAALGGSEVDGRVSGRGLPLAATLAMFGGPADAAARVDLDGSVRLPLQDLRQTSIDAQVAAFDVNYRGRRAELLAGRVQLDSDALVLQDAVLVQGANTIFVPLAHVPAPPFDACTVLDHTTAQIRADLRDVPGLLRATEPDASIGELPPHHLAFAATLIDDTLVVEDGSFTTEKNRVTVQKGRVPLHEGARAILFDDGLDMALDVDLQDIAAAARLLTGDLLGALPIQSGSISGHAHVRGGAGGPRGEIGLTARGLVVNETSFDQVDLAAGLDEDMIDVAHLDARSSLGTLSGGGRYHFAEKRFEGAHLEVDLSDLEQLAPRALPSGALRIQARADGQLNELDGTVTLRANDLLWHDMLIEGFVLDATAEHGKIRIARAFAREGGVSARLAGTAEALDKRGTQWRFVLDELVLRLADETSSIARRATIEVSAHDFAVRDLLLAGAAGSVAADVSYSRGVGCADVHAIGILPRFVLQRLQPWLPPDAQLDAELSAQWEPGELEVTTSGHAQGTGPDPDQPSTATLSWKAELAQQRLVIEELALRGDPVTSQRARALAPATATIAGSFPLDPFGSELLPDGPVELHVRAEADEVAVLPLPQAWSAVRGALHGSVDLEGSWSNVRGAVSIDADHIALPAWNGIPTIGPAEVSARVLLGDEVQVEHVSLRVAVSENGVPAHLEGSGSIGAPLDARAWLHGLPGSILDAPLAASLKLDAVDLAPLAEHLTALRRTGGRAAAALEISGTAREPRIEGTATLEDGEIRTATNLPSIAGVSAAVHFDGAKLLIDKLDGEMGGAPFKMSGEMLVFDPAPRLDLAFEGQSILLWRQPDVTVRADAHLTLKGPIDALVLAGDLALRDARYSRKFDFLSLPARSRASTGRRGFQLFALQDPPFSTMALDLHVTSATPFVVANNVLHIELSPDLRLQGTGEVPELRGTVNIEPSRVLLPSGTLRIRSGRIEFRADQPDVPTLDIQATSHMQGYDVEVNVVGPYDNPRVDVSSVPPLAREDVVMLVLTGRPPSNNLTLATGERAAVDVAVYIARDVAAAWLSGENEIGSEDSLAERIEVIVGAETTKTGVDSVLVRMRLAGKPGERGSGWYVTGERDVYDFYNYGLRFVFTFQ